MQKIGKKSLFLVALSILATQVSAVNIQNFKVTPNGSTYLEFSWDKLDNSDIDQETHYGLQWNTIQSKIRTDEPTQARISTSKNSFKMLRGNDVFDKDTDYYARVYGFYRGDMQRKSYLTKGSKILKFKWLHNGNIETSYLDANDPVIVDNNATTTVAKDFQRISATPYDTSVQINWSRTNDIFDNYSLTLGTDSTLSAPIKEFSVNKNSIKALITGLEPGKKYYIAGFLERNGRQYGKGKTISFTTLPKFDAVKKRRFNKYILGKKHYGELLSIDNGNSSNEEVETTSNVTANSSTESKNARIAELKKLIAKYSAELRQLEAQNPAKKITLTGRRTSRKSSLSSRLRNWRSNR